MRCANPRARATSTPFVDDVLDGARVVLCRVLGGRRGWPGGFDRLRRALPRERRSRCSRSAARPQPDAEMTALSTAPSGAVAQAGEYLRHGDVDNVEQLLRFLADTFLLEGFGFDAPHEVARPRRLPSRPRRRDARAGARRPRPGPSGRRDLLLPLAPPDRQHGLRRRAVRRDRARRRATRCRCGATRCGATGDGRVAALELLDGHVDALVTTMLATGGSGAAATPRGDRRRRDGRTGTRARSRRSTCRSSRRVCATTSRAALGGGRRRACCRSTPRRRSRSPSSTGASSAARSPSRSATARTRRSACPSRATSPTPSAATASRGSRPPRAAARPGRARRRVAVLLTSFPTKHARIGMAVGLDTPGQRARAARRACAPTGCDVDRHPFSDGDELMHALIAAGGHDPEFLTDEQLAAAPLRLPVADYLDWYATLRRKLTRRDGALGPAARRPLPRRRRLRDRRPRARQRRRRDPAAARLRRRPGRDLPRPRAAADAPLPRRYRWLDHHWGADAIVHLGKHGTLEWLPGKMLALSASCAPDAALGSMPLVYPFVVNDPGEGVQAKRRAHAVDRRPPRAADDARRHLRRARRARGAARRVRAPGGARPVQAARRSARRSGRRSRRPTCRPTSAIERAPGRPRARSSSTSTATSARSRTSRSRTACTCSAPRPRDRSCAG